MATVCTVRGAFKPWGTAPTIHPESAFTPPHPTAPPEKVLRAGSCGRGRGRGRGRHMTTANRLTDIARRGVDDRPGRSQTSRPRPFTPCVVYACVRQRVPRALVAGRPADFGGPARAISRSRIRSQHHGSAPGAGNCCTRITTADGDT